MRFKTGFVSVVIVFSILFQLSASQQTLYLAAGDAISAYTINPDDGKLTASQTVELAGAGAFTFSKDGSRLYAMAGGRDAPGMATFDRTPDGKLSLLNLAPVSLFSGYLQVDHTGNYIAGHSYREGKALLWKLEEGVYQGETVQELDLEEKAHCAVFSPDHRWLLVPATAPNKVFVNAFDPEAGTLTPNDPPYGMGPEGEDQARQPRHLIFHPLLPDMVYTTNERENPGVCVWSWNTENGALKPVQNIVTAQENLEGRISASTLHLTPDARFLYIANRNIINKKTKTGRSSIVGFRVDSENGRLTLIGHTPCENVPRTFCIDQTGNYLYVAGQHDERLGVYRIDQETGTLMKIEQHAVGKAPAWSEVR